MLTENIVAENESPKQKKRGGVLRCNARKIGVIILVVAVIGIGLGSALLAIQYTGLRSAYDFLSLPLITLPESDIMTQAEAQAYVASGGDSWIARTIVDDPDSYIAHPDTVWIDDGSENGKIIAVYPLGHGKGEIAMRVSYDMGVTWSDRVEGLPESWTESQETPTVYNLTEGMSFDETDGIIGLDNSEQVIVLISGCPYWVATGDKANGFNFSYSVDGGATWTEFENYYGIEWANANGEDAYDAIVAMASLTQLKDEDGNYINQWMGLFHDHDFNVYKTILTVDVEYDENGELEISFDWSEPKSLFGAGSDNDLYAQKYAMCEVEAIRWNDAIILLGRAEKRKTNSLITVSYDEGETWSTIQELPYDLCGDRHKAEFLNTDGDLIISFRQVIPEKEGPLSTTSRIGTGWYAWIGNVEALLSYADSDAENIQGYVLIELGASNLDNGYSGVIVQNGIVNLVGYGYFLSSKSTPCIMSVTLSVSAFQF